MLTVTASPAEETFAAEPLDLRLPLLGAAAWLGGLNGAYLTGPDRGLTHNLVLALLFSGAVIGAGVARQLPTARLFLLCGALTFLAVLAASVLRQQSISATPVADFAKRGAFVEGQGQISSDPRLHQGQYADFVVVKVRLTQVSARGATFDVSTPILVMADSEWSTIPLGSHVAFSGLLDVSQDRDVAGILRARGTPQVLANPPGWWQGAEHIRAALRESVAHRPADQRALVPALVVGDDARIDESLSAAFNSTGLTHLLAVSGTNLTLLVGFLLLTARWCGVRGSWLYAVGAVGIIGFILLARFEPSVIRAAAMGTVGLIGLGTNGRQRGGRALGAAVIAVLLIEPALANSPGFALSVLATGGIVYLAPVWRDALSEWVPRWIAEAIAVPAAAQLVCTPLVAAISGQVSLVAVGANLLAAPAVGPATVLGLLGGFLGALWTPLGAIAGTVASWCAGWIVLIARRGADLPTPDVGWGTGVGWLLVLTALCLAAAFLAPFVLRRWLLVLIISAALVGVVLTRVPTPGWPPSGWIFAACDVGQGDALVLNAGQGEAVVIDAGPDPELVDACLRRLDVERVPLIILTHFHADHVDGLEGVLRGRDTTMIETTGVRLPADRVESVEASIREHEVPSQVTPFGVTRQVGEVRLQSLWPAASTSDVLGSSDLGSVNVSETDPNNASVVLLAEVGGRRILLTGDVEPPAQAQISRLIGEAKVDILKVPHHGSRFQDFDFLVGLRPQIAVFSAGVDNTYGHPAPETLSVLEASGITIARTDQGGDVVVVNADDGLEVIAPHLSGR